MRRKNKMREKFILKLKKCLVLGMCLCIFQTTVSAATPWSQSNGIFMMVMEMKLKVQLQKE